MLSRRLLLISSSTRFGSGFLDHCQRPIVDFLGDIQTLLFIPYALQDCDAYAAKVSERFGRMGCTVSSIHTMNDPAGAVLDARALFVGGGNTFRLLDGLVRHALIEPIRKRVFQGMPYIGSSAGTNVACPTIRTTNDMPIVQPPSFSALKLVGFNINPHYVNREAGATHMGETRDDRIREFHEENDVPVIGLREGSLLGVSGKEILLLGSEAARVFRKQKEPCEFPVGSRLDFLEA